MRRKSKFLGVLKFLLMGVAFLAVIGFSVMTLWNWLIPELFNGPVITFWQALGLCLLGKLLFGWHGHGGGGPWKGKREWRRKMQERMANMTPEEKSKLKERFSRCMPGGNWYDDPDDYNTGNRPPSKPDTGPASL